MLIALGHKSQIQTQQLRRAEDRKAFDYIFLFEPFEAPPHPRASKLIRFGFNLARDTQTK